MLRLLISGMVLISAALFASAADLPAELDLKGYPTPTRVIRVRTSSELRQALNTAKGGDEIILRSGEEFVGPFVLRAREQGGWVTLRSDAVALDETGRVEIGDAGRMAKLVTPD